LNGAKYFRLRTIQDPVFLKNTYTRGGDKEMEKTLTYYAIKNEKPAMDVEASKKYPTHKRILQHLRFVESIMGEPGRSNHGFRTHQTKKATSWVTFFI
jgi:hypothetical protein